jgi:hypothetical protein
MIRQFRGPVVFSPYIFELGRDIYRLFRSQYEFCREFVIILHGIEHMSVALEEVHIMLFEPKSTLNTGNIQNERTVANFGKI